MKIDAFLNWSHLFPSGEKRIKGSFLDLVKEIIALESKRRMPPFQVFAKILAIGGVGGGQAGGLRWKPIELQANTYEAMCQLLPNTKAPTNCNATTLLEWRAWCMREDYDWPYEENLRFLIRMEAATIKRDAGGEKELLDFLDCYAEYSKFIEEQIARQT